MDHQDLMHLETSPLSVAAPETEALGDREEEPRAQVAGRNQLRPARAARAVAGLLAGRRAGQPEVQGASPEAHKKRQLDLVGEVALAEAAKPIRVAAAQPHLPEAAMAHREQI